MLYLAIRTNVNSLLEVAENVLMRRLKNHFIFRSIAHNMELAEELGMQKFQGRLYYHELLRQDAVSKAIHASTAYSTQTSDLTEKQRLALFCGYWSLTHYWRDVPLIVRNKPLPPLTSCTASGHEICQAEWNKVWDVDNFKQKVDLPARLWSFGEAGKNSFVINFVSNFLFDSISSGSSKNPQGQTMQPCGVSEINLIIKQLQDTLGDHFLGSQA
jgi:hypothetical protein